MKGQAEGARNEVAAEGPEADEFRALIEVGLKDLVEGNTMSHEELKERLIRWRQSSDR
jgi:hypothetical protein